MSTKTTFKRIALVAVSALGFGLLSVMPANAAALNQDAQVALARAADYVTTGATASVVISVNAANAQTNGDDTTVTAALATKPATSTATLAANVSITTTGEALDNTTGSYAASTGVYTLTSTGAVQDAATAAGTLNLVTDVAGTYTVTVTGLGVAATTYTVYATTISIPSRVYRTAGNVDQNLLWQSDVALTDAGVAKLRMRITSVPASANANTVEVGDQFADGTLTATADTDDVFDLGRGNGDADDGSTIAVPADGDALAFSYTDGVNVGDSFIGGSDLNGDGDYADLGELAPENHTGDYLNVAGTYGVFMWIDTDNDGGLDTNEVRVTGSFIMGGAPSSLTITPLQTTIAEDLELDLRIGVLDANGNFTKINSGESVDLTASNVTGTATRYLAAGTSVSTSTDDNLASLDNTSALSTDDLGYDERTYIATVRSSAGGTIRVTGNFSGTLLPLATAASSGTITITTSTSVTSIEVTSTNVTADNTKLKTAPAALDAAGETGNVFVNLATGLAVSFKVTGTAGSYFPVTIGGSNIATVLNGVTSYQIGADGTRTITITPTSAVDGSTYTISVPVGAGSATYTVEYDIATVLASTITVAEIPTGVSRDIRAAGATNTFTVTVRDEFGKAYSDYEVRLTTSSTSRNASRLIYANTNASGVATVSFADTSTSTTVLTDAVTVAVFAPANLASAITSFAITLDYRGSLGSLTLTGGSTATTTVKRTVVNADLLTDAVAETSTAIAIDNELVDSTGGAVTGYRTTYTGSAGLLFIADSNNDNDVNDELLGGTFADGATSVIVPNNTQVFVLSTKSGVGTITVTSGGLTRTATVTFITKADLSTARNVAISAPASGVAGKLVSAQATVTDGHGNTIAGATVVFVRSGGRFVTGASSVNVTTDANGVAAIDLTSDSAATVTVTASLPVAGNESAGIADDPVTGFTAASGAKSASIAFTGTASDEIAAAKAAADAATAAATKAGADATAAANAATAAAKAAEAAAVAAAKAAEEQAAKAVAAAKAAEAAAVAKAEEATDASLEAIDAANAATDAANLAAEAADAATVAAEEARDAADAATAAVEALASEISTLISGLRAQITTLANTVAKIAKKVRA